MQPKSISLRRMTASYCLALSIIAGLSIASHVMNVLSLQKNEGIAAVINQTGRQRMLSQRIAGLSAQYMLGNSSVKESLKATIDLFETSHNALVSNLQNSAEDDSTTRELQNFYFAEPNSLDSEAKGFIADARGLMQTKPGNPDLLALASRIFAEANSPLLAKLDKVVSLHQRDGERRIRALEYLQWGILATVLLTLCWEGTVIFRPLIHRIKAYTSQLEFLAGTDPLTGAANRRGFTESCEREIARSKRYRRPVSLMMIDLDHFKSINDTYGHDAGDQVLKSVAGVLQKTLRQMDILGRLGGEEFAVLLLETQLLGAAIVAERLRERFASMTLQYREQSIKFTVSIGVTEINQFSAGLDDALRFADTLMYKAKNSGRNRVIADQVCQDTGAVALVQEKATV